MSKITSECIASYSYAFSDYFGIAFKHQIVSLAPGTDCTIRFCGLFYVRHSNRLQADLGNLDTSICRRLIKTLALDKRQGTSWLGNYDKTSVTSLFGSYSRLLKGDVKTCERESLRRRGYRKMSKITSAFLALWKCF